MTIKAKVSFIGRLCMNAGEEKKVNSSPFIQELIKKGYVEEVISPQKKKKKKEDNT